MTIYVPTDEYSGVSLGKDIPGMGPFRNFTPKLQGPGSAKIKIAIRAAQFGYRYFRKNPRFGARIGAVAGGAGVRYAADNQYRETRGSAFTVRSGKRSYNGFKYRVRKSKSCCCCTPRRKRGK